MLTSLVRAVAGAAARRPKTTIALWFVFVAACIFSGSVYATKTLSDADGNVGQSATADAQLSRAGLQDPPSESILVRGATPQAASGASSALVAALRSNRDVRAVHSGADSPALRAQGGRAVLVQATLRGTLDDADTRADSVARSVAAVHKAHPGAQFQQTGSGSFDSAITKVVSDDLGTSEMLSVPLTLAILLVAFGAFVAASVPLLLALTSVAAAFGALGIVSQITPISDTTSSVLVLIGLAVGVDYSLFYVRREREERRNGLGPDAALAASAATVGRAIVVSGVTVMVALAGLLATGMKVFESMALGTILVVAIAMIGSLTVLPATLALLGDRVDRGRLPFIGRRRSNVGDRAWGALARVVTRRPAASLITAVCVLGTLATFATQLKPADAGIDSLPADLPVVKAQKQIEATFGASPDPGVIVVSGHGLQAREAQLQALGRRAADATGARGRIDVSFARDGRTAAVAVPMPGGGRSASDTAVARIRSDVLSSASSVQPGASAVLGGDDASSKDFTDRLKTATPVVVGIVLLLAFALLFASFRSAKLAVSVIALNLLSIAASYGVMTAVFQNHWAEGLLGFKSTGTIANYLPLMAFVILFGLSMDYTILMLERIREARAAGRNARDAAAEGIGATGSTVTSAALVMVAVFAVFGTLRLLEMKQLGVGLATAVLLDATIVRGLALPAVVSLIGERGWQVPVRPRSRRRGWDDQPRVALATTGDGQGA